MSDKELELNAKCGTSFRVVNVSNNHIYLDIDFGDYLHSIVLHVDEASQLADILKMAVKSNSGG